MSQTCTRRSSTSPLPLARTALLLLLQVLLPLLLLRQLLLRQLLLLLRQLLLLLLLRHFLLRKVALQARSCRLRPSAVVSSVSGLTGRTGR